MLNCLKVQGRLRNDPRPDTLHHSVLSQMDWAMCRPLHSLVCFLHADWKEIARQFWAGLQPCMVMKTGVLEMMLRKRTVVAQWKQGLRILVPVNQVRNIWPDLQRQSTSINRGSIGVSDVGAQTTWSVFAQKVWMVPLIKQLVDSLEQNIGCWRQAFIQPTAELHQVWERIEMLCLIWVLRGSMSMLRTCEKLHGGVGLAYMCGDVRLV